MIDLSVVIPVFHENSYLSRTLNDLARQTFIFRAEILLSEFNPDRLDFTKNTITKFHEDWPDIPIRLIEVYRPGIAFARNEGIMKARGDVVVNLDADSRFSHVSGLQMMTEPIFARQAVCTICNNDWDLTQIPEGRLDDMAIPQAVVEGLNVLQSTTNWPALEPGSCFNKEVYIQSGGFPDVEQSEIFFMAHRIFWRYPGQIKHIKGVSVIVSPRRALRFKKEGLKTLDYSRAYRKDSIHSLE